MTDARFFKKETELKWGEFTPEDLLKQLYKNKNTELMTDMEIEQMLEDLI